MSQSLEELRLTDQFYDFIIKVKDREFPIHTAFLATRSPVLESMFLEAMKDKFTSMVNIPDCEPDIFEAFLFYLYSEKSDMISSSNVTSLYDVAEKYDVKCLKKDCIRFMKRNLTVDLIIDVLALAVKCEDEELLEYAKDFFVSNNQMIISTTKWQDFAVENPVLANELMEKTEIVPLMET